LALEEDVVALVLVLVERTGTGGAGCRSTWALLTLARRLGPTVAVVCGRVDAASIALFGRFGAQTVCAVTCPEMDEYPAAARVETLVELARRMSPTAILISSGQAGQEIAARVAVRLDSGIVTDTTDIRMGPDGPVALKPVLAGSYLVEAGVVRGIPVFTVQTQAVTPVALDAATAEPTIHQLDITLPARVRAVRRVSRVATSGRPADLTTAAVVVAGGRGIGSRASFRLVDQVADALGGAVGGSHTAAELGWCPRDAEIGQAGRVVHPRLYLALGISGSVRHRAGMQSAGTIVAIDRDPAAPIFQVADLGVVGDLHQVVPELLAEIRRRRAQLTIESPRHGGVV
jgi:electron transfer flavoprotein alpha subunit